MKIECLRIDPAGRYGVLLGLAGTMMATANGVGTQPVLRGVCVLENILGMPPPPVPQNVPALAPDTQGTTTPRELLSAQWLVANIDLVSECPAEKLMIYATGRVPSYSEQVEMKAIVERVTGDGGGFPDLLIALIESKTFRTR